MIIAFGYSKTKKLKSAYSLRKKNYELIKLNKK